MQRVIIEIEKNDDLQLLILLAQRIGLKIVMPSEQIIDEEKRKKNLQIIANGGGTAYIQDPVEWQREQRKDSALPFRD